MKRFITIWILVSAGLNIWQSIHIKKLEEKRPMVIYKADNQGAEIKGAARLLSWKCFEVSIAISEEKRS